jgi:predicted nucleotidyltransferase
MSSIWHDFSPRPDLESAGTLVRDVAAVSPEPLIVGAFARDLHLHYRWGIAIDRATTDLDLAVAVPDWNAYRALRERLLATAAFAETTVAHRLRHHAGTMLDLVPFGGVETAGRELRWPPNANPIMDVFGYREAYDVALPIVLPQTAHARLVSVPCLVMLKLFCWQDRHTRRPGDDAQDLWQLMRHYLDCGNGDRVFDEFSEWTQAGDFDYDLCGPRMLGQDIREEAGANAAARLVALLRSHVDPQHPSVLTNEMNRHAPERARILLEGLLRGLEESN